MARKCSVFFIYLFIYYWFKDSVFIAVKRDAKFLTILCM